MTETAGSTLESIIKDMTPNDSERAAAARHRASLESWLKNDLGIIRMRETGSWYHGTAISGRSDVDYFVTMPGPRPESSSTSLEILYRSLSRGVKNGIVRIDRPAVNVNYFGGGPAVEITPAYFVGTDDYEIPDPDGSGWIRSNPAVHLDYVNTAQRHTNGKAKNLARLVKTWKERNRVPLSSFYLEMRTAKHAHENQVIIYDWDLRDIFKGLSGDGLREMNDPTAYGRRISTGATDIVQKLNAKYAVDKAARLASLAKDASGSGHNALAIGYWRQLFAITS